MRIIPLHVVLFAAAATFAGSHGACGAAINPFDQANGFNIFVERNFYINQGHPEGPVAAGGNLRFGSGSEVAQKYSGSYIAPGDTTPAGLVVGGAVEFGNSSGEFKLNTPSNLKVGSGGYTVWPNNPGDTVINQSGAANANTQPRIYLRTDQTASSVSAPSGINFAGAFGSFDALAQEMDALPANYTASSFGGLGSANQTISFNPNTGLTVVDLTAAQFRNIQNINWGQQPSANRTVLFNIDLSGLTTYDLGYAAMGISESVAPYVMFNFGTFDGALRFVGGQAVVGSVFAPNADITKTGTYIHGQVIGESFLFNDGEVHYHLNQVTYVPVPEPATIGFGLALLGFCAMHARSRLAGKAD